MILIKFNLIEFTEYLHIIYLIFTEVPVILGEVDVSFKQKQSSPCFYGLV
jgi:hypothetical protein